MRREATYIPPGQIPIFANLWEIEISHSESKMFDGLNLISTNVTTVMMILGGGKEKCIIFVGTI